jgi:hypothetical protein
VPFGDNVVWIGTALVVAQMRQVEFVGTLASCGHLAGSEFACSIRCVTEVQAYGMPSAKLLVLADILSAETHTEVDNR